MLVELLISLLILPAFAQCPGGLEKIDPSSAQFLAKPCLEIINIQLSKDFLNYAQFNSSVFLGGQWSQMQAKNMNISSAALKGLRIENSDLSQSLFQKTQFLGTRIVRTQIKKADLKSAIGTSCYFEHVSFSGTDFRSAHFENCHFLKCSFDRIVYNSQTLLPKSVMDQKDDSWIYAD